MIKFFRKIRQRLLAGNRFSKYLIYAIGEIVLVVIGILIALHINNWNEKRKDKEVEYKILQSLLTEFENAESELKYDDTSRVEIRNAINSVLKIRSEKDDKLLNFDSTASLLNSIKDYRFYTPSHPQLNDLQSSGKFDMISSKETKERILNYIEMWERITILEKNAQNGIINNLYPYLSKQCDLSLLSIKNTEKQEELVAQFEVTLKDRTFGSLMRLRLEELYALMYYSEILMRDIKSCQESINEVIANLEQ